MDFTNFFKTKKHNIASIIYPLDKIPFSYYHFFFGHVLSKTLQSTSEKLLNLTRDFLVVTSGSEIKILWFVLLGFFLFTIFTWIIHTAFLFISSLIEHTCFSCAAGHIYTTQCIYIHIFVKSSTHVFRLKLDTWIIHTPFIFTFSWSLLYCLSVYYYLTFYWNYFFSKCVFLCALY